MDRRIKLTALALALCLTGQAWAQDPGATAFIDAPPTESWPFPSRIGVGHYTGPGVGYDTSFTTLEGFLPFNPSGTNILVFGDLHGLLNNSSVTAANLGGGARYYMPGLDRILAGNCYFDNRQTGQATFNQVGFGLESLGRYIDVRSNAYFVVTDDNKLLGSSFSDPTFAGFNILLNRALAYQRAMSGFDVEMGGPLPWTQNLLRGYVGAYNFQGGGNQQAWGPRGRLEANINQYLAMNLAVQNDTLFGTTVVFGGQINYGGIRSRRSDRRDDVRSRLADPVVRNYNVVVKDHTEVSQVVATDPATGQPITVLHAAAGAAGGGDGSFERPFTTLGSVQGSPRFTTTNILFVQNGNYPGGIALAPGQRLLGDGIAHAFTSQQGTFNLPILMAGATPTITVYDQTFLATPTAVVLASNTEVSGMALGPVAVDNAIGIGGNNLTGTININRNSILGTAANVNQIGIVISPPTTARLNITDNTINLPGANSQGIVVTVATVNPTWNFVNNNVTANLAGTGIRLTTAGSGSTQVNLIGNTTSNGIRLNAVGTTTQQYFLSNNAGTFGTLGTGTLTQVFTPFP